MTIQLLVDTVEVYPAGSGVSTANAAGSSTVLGTGRALKRATAASAGVAAGSAVGRGGYSGDSRGVSSALAIGSNLTPSTPSVGQHIVLALDTVPVYEAGGGGLTYRAQSAGSSTAVAVGVQRVVGQAVAHGSSGANAQGLLPNQSIARAAGSSTALAAVFAQSVARASGTSIVSTQIDTAPPLSVRSLTSAMSSTIGQARVKPVILYEGAFKDGFLHLWSGIGPLDWNDVTFTGAGDLLQISELEETDQQQASGVVVSLSAVPSNKIALALASVRRNDPGHIWLGFLDDSDRLIDAPQTIFRGRLDKVDVDDSNDNQATIKASYENEMITFEHPREIRYTDQEQQRLHPGDTGLRYIASLQDKELRWGSRP